MMFIVSGTLFEHPLKYHNVSLMLTALYMCVYANSKGYS